jgi:hypothetical protein
MTREIIRERCQQSVSGGTGAKGSSPIVMHGQVHRPPAGTEEFPRHAQPFIVADDPEDIRLHGMQTIHHLADTMGGASSKQ